LIAFADLKKHSYLYWFGFPAIVPSSPFQAKPPQQANLIFSKQEQQQILTQLIQYKQKKKENFGGNFPPFFVLKRQDSNIFVLTLKEWRQKEINTSLDQVFFCFVDPCPLQSNPGWPLRNFLVYLSKVLSSTKEGDETLQILSFREQIHHLTVVSNDFEWSCNSLLFQVKTCFSSFVTTTSVTGWEPNVRGKMGPRLMELGGILDPIRLAETSVDLNLKLMRWRQLPSLNLELLASTRCLLLGAGTLGCYTARSLLSWGFRHITFVDNSVVSHSNPVRQPLYEFNDCGKPKAQAAAASLKRIFPLVESKGVYLSIPMAGHALSNSQLLQEAQDSLIQLEQLIDAHDVVFLGTDSRESRWLPTVLCTLKKKTLINAALGFDSYLVMRHGIPGSNLGCYFCNDVVSPRDSLKDRTLDQMCTVTRPGLAPMAGALGVEILVALLHAPDGPLTSAEKPEDGSRPLGFIPHQIRGFLNSFNSMLIKGEAFDKCIACSSFVVDAFAQDKFELLQNACNFTTYLEELTGLNKLTEAADTLLLQMENEEDSEDDF
jgi:ubiquitin-like modifier-activating enzyme ATG7